MKAGAIKAWFKKHFGIPVRVRTVKCKRPFVQVWIPYKGTPKIGESLVYEHRFPESLGNKLMRIVYKGHASLEEQNWGGNISSTSLSFDEDEWNQLQSHPDFKEN